MKWFLMLVTLVSLGLFPAPMDNRAWAAEEGSGLPPVEQPVVREGDFAIGLAEALGVGSAESEAQAESDLAAVGIAPPNGWISDYPVTPDTLEALYEAIGVAAGANTLTMDQEEALKKYSELTASLGLPIRPDEDAVEPQEGPAAAYGPYSDPSEVSGYYYSEGLPLVTYYAPPSDYYYNYRWVPYPFWWNRYWFSGFFVLNDFYSFRNVVIVKRHGHKFVTHKRVTNHFYDKKRERFGRVDPLERLRAYNFRKYDDNPPENGFRDNQARRGSDSASGRDSKRARLFMEREGGWRNGSSSGFTHEGLQGPGWNHRFDAIERVDHYQGAHPSNDRAWRIRGSEPDHGMGQRFESRSSGLDRGGPRPLSLGSGNFDPSFGYPRNERGGRDFRSPAFQSGGSTGYRSFSEGPIGGGRGLSRGGGSIGPGFSGSRGSGGGGGGCRGGC
jgi:hypothetical protein